MNKEGIILINYTKDRPFTACARPRRSLARALRAVGPLAPCARPRHSLARTQNN